MVRRLLQTSRTNDTELSYALSLRSVAVKCMLQLRTQYLSSLRQTLIDRKKIDHSSNCGNISTYIMCNMISHVLTNYSK